MPRFHVAQGEVGTEEVGWALWGFNNYGCLSHPSILVSPSCARDSYCFLLTVHGGVALWAGGVVGNLSEGFHEVPEFYGNLC